MLFDAAERGGEGLWVRSSLGVVTGFRARDSSARVTWVGGIELFSDAYVNKKLLSAERKEKGYQSQRDGVRITGRLDARRKSGNEQFSRDIATWTFQDNLVLRVDGTSHHIRNETTPRDEYTINDNIVCHPHLLMNW